MTKLYIADEVFRDMNSMAQAIVKIDADIKRANAVIDALKKARSEIEQVLIREMTVVKQSKFTLEDGPEIVRSQKESISFPKQDNGGKDTAFSYLEECYKAGIIGVRDYLDLQQSRISEPFVRELEERAEKYNKQGEGAAGFVPISKSPFPRFTRETISVHKAKPKIKEL